MTNKRPTSRARGRQNNPMKEFEMKEFEMTERDYVMASMIFIIIVLAILLVLSLWQTQRVIDAWATDQAYWISRVKELSR